MTDQKPLLELINVSKSYVSESENINPLRDINIKIYEGQFIAIVGRSGSGKTTLLNVMAGLDKPTSGDILIKGSNMTAMDENSLTEIRRTTIGFIFQSFGLLPLLSAFENVELPLRISGVEHGERSNRTKEALDIVGLNPRSNHRPYELSGGEQQRVSIARAIVTKPAIILADEPTGELDSTNAKSIFGLFKDMVVEQGMTIIAATHDSSLLSMADEVKEIRNGGLYEVQSEDQRYR
ncbi:MAG TPA: ABC transporter ATP-binding protein [SAR202 cluster bacterium]|jgi:ABC-type lipoprotein export system ATPase subunit|nr:ABC transporter ATP-binding protein [SAR202 cluster bacterium]|tara:strand:+ start:2227 stop:2937 length:711 start_codon:yes stop_codon:yes gene_type:complete